MRNNESEAVWMEQIDRMKEVDLACVNRALRNLIPYSSTPDFGR